MCYSSCLFGFFYVTKGIGWIYHHPAPSCKNIRDVGDSKGDGKYWIDPVKNGKPFKVYCDMTIDGGLLSRIKKHVISLSKAKFLFPSLL